jgi:hypothetical protein
LDDNGRFRRYVTSETGSHDSMPRCSIPLPSRCTKLMCQHNTNFDAKALRNLGGKWRKEKVKVGRVEKKVWPRPSAPLQRFVLSGICTTPAVS